MSVTLQFDVSFGKQGRRARQDLCLTAKDEQSPPGRIPRVSRLLALAIRFHRLLRDGQIADYTELARLGHVSRARVSQIMNLLLLAPDIQEQILFLPLTVKGHDPIHMRLLQPIALEADWQKQRRRWKRLVSTACERRTGSTRPTS